MPKTIAFHLNQFCERGTEVAIYDYALYNETILGNTSIIVYPTSAWVHKNHLSVPTYTPSVELKFQMSFSCYSFTDKKSLETILVDNNVDVFYILKSGYMEPLPTDIIPVCVHCIFICTETDKHGDSYIAISNDVARGTNMNVVPHICKTLSKSQNNMRKQLKIPEDAFVVGRYGGYETFDIDFVREVVVEIAKSDAKTIFLFMNTERFCDLPNVIFLDKSTDEREKEMFIRTCDIMLHARKQGESFGLAIAEFSAAGKPILVWKHKGQRMNNEDMNHIDILGDTGNYYHDSDSLRSLLKAKSGYKIPVDYSTIFSPEIVMKLFDKYVIEECCRTK